MSTFELKAVWTGDLKSGSGFLETGRLSCAITLPKEFGGSGIGTNPEEMLLGAASSCFLMTLAGVLKRLGLNADVIELSSLAAFSFDGKSLSLDHIEHRPSLRGVNIDDEAIRAAYQMAEKSCMVAKALNVPVRVVTTSQRNQPHVDFTEIHN